MSLNCGWSKAEILAVDMNISYGQEYSCYCIDLANEVGYHEGRLESFNSKAVSEYLELFFEIMWREEF